MLVVCACRKGSFVPFRCGVFRPILLQRKMRVEAAKPLPAFFFADRRRLAMLYFSSVQDGISPAAGAQFSLATACNPLKCTQL